MSTSSSTNRSRVYKCDAFYWIDGELQAACYKHAMYEMYSSMNGDQRDVFVEEINKHELGILAQERLAYVEAEFENYKARMIRDVFVGFDVGIVVDCHLGYVIVLDGSIKEGCDTVGKAGISALVKCTSVIRQLAYALYGEEYLRRPTQADVEKLYAFHENKHGFPYQSPVLNDLKVGKTPEVPFVTNDVTYKWGYYLTDGIYPEWVVLMKSISQPGSNDVKRIRYKQAHEAARKDVERAFGVLKKKWAIVRTPARSRSLKRITHLMYTCIILHNMIRKEKGKAISPDFYPEEQHREDDPVRSAQDRLRVIREIHDEETHLNLKADLVEHIWHRTNAN
ncbi:putative nuclease HARBI1 isoform X2 [Tanacetum coccineum]